MEKTTGKLDQGNLLLIINLDSWQKFLTFSSWKYGFLEVFLSKKALNYKRQDKRL